MSLFIFKKTQCEELEINTSIPCDIINVRKETLSDNVRNDIFLQKLCAVYIVFLLELRINYIVLRGQLRNK